MFAKWEVPFGNQIQTCIRRTHLPIWIVRIAIFIRKMKRKFKSLIENPNWLEGCDLNQFLQTFTTARTAAKDAFEGRTLRWKSRPLQWMTSARS